MDVKSEQKELERGEKQHCQQPKRKIKAVILSSVGVTERGLRWCSVSILNLCRNHRPTTGTQFEPTFQHVWEEKAEKKGEMHKRQVAER